MNREYLPSKIFMIRIAVIVGIIVIIFGTSKLFNYFKNKQANRGPVSMTVGDLTQKDTNKNGIPDWEEYLWGLDPNKNGEENKEFIQSKKAILSQNQQIDESGNLDSISENELLSRQFFATVISLQQTGDLNDESIKSITEAIGKNVEVEDMSNLYENNMMTIIDDSSASKEKYRNSLVSLINKYSESDLGNELTLIIQGLNNQDPQALYATKSIATAYQDFGRDFMKVPTPRSIVSIHLSAANNYEKTGQSILNLTKGLSDPIIGMSAILNYKKYNDTLASDLEKIYDFLQ